MGFVVIFFLYAHTYWCYSSIVRSLTLFNCKSCSYTCTHTLHTFQICMCVYILCACAFLFPLVDGWKSIWGVTSNWNAAYLTMTFPFNFIAHRYFDAHLIVGTDNLRGKEQSIRSIYYVYGVVRCVWKCMLFGFARFACYVLCLA